MIFVINVILTSLIIVVALSLLYMGFYMAHQWLLRLDYKLVGIVAGFTALLIICIMCMAAILFRV